MQVQCCPAVAHQPRVQIPRQAQAVQKQIKRELTPNAAVSADIFAQFEFHIPLYAAMWGVFRESTIAASGFLCGFKEVLSAAVSRGNRSVICGKWHVQLAASAGVAGIQNAWRHKSLVHLPQCPARYKAIVLWFRDATHLGFFQEHVRPLPPRASSERRGRSQAPRPVLSGGQPFPPEAPGAAGGTGGSRW